MLLFLFSDLSWVCFTFIYVSLWKEYGLVAGQVHVREGTEMGAQNQRHPRCHMRHLMSNEMISCMRHSAVWQNGLARSGDRSRP
jgi:hypothetical protein